MKYVLVPVEPTEEMKRKAYRAVRTALNQGRLSRPDECERCGSSPAPATDGRAKIHAHHSDYSKPLDVEWICAKCHREETPLPSIMGGPANGEVNGASKLNADLVRYIRTSPLGCIRLGRKLGVDKKTIQRVRTGETWSHV